MAGVVSHMLGVNAVAGGGGAAVTPTTFTVGVNTSGVSTTTFGYTLSGLTVGRPVLVFIWGISTNVGLSRFFSSFSTTDGSAALISGHTANGTGRPFGIYAITGFSGTSLDVSIVFNGTMQTCYMGHVELTGTVQTAYDNRTGATPNTAGSIITATSTPGITVPSGGIAFGMAVSVDSSQNLTFTADAGSAVEIVDVALTGGVGNNKGGLCTFDNASATTFSVATGTATSKWTTAFSWAP
jgi:hypothetical protein